MSGARRDLPDPVRCAASRRRATAVGKRCAALAAGLLLASGAARAGALEDCRGLTRTQSELMACLQSARKQATNDMLESFLGVEQILGEREPDAGRSPALAALKQAQRDFERYLQAHCRVAQALASGESVGPVAAACEVDQLRARAAALEALARSHRN